MCMVFYLVKRKINLQKKKVNKLLTILSLLLFASCSRNVLPTVQTVIKDSIVHTSQTIHTRDTIYFAGDSVEISVAIPCPEAVINQVAKSGKTVVSAKIEKGRLTVNCKTDSMQAIIDSLTIVKQKEVFKTITTTVQVPVEVIKHTIPAWCWWLLAFNACAIIYKFRHQLIALWP